MTLMLHGIGNGGDSVNAIGKGNMSPLHSQRTITVDLYNAQNTLVKTTQGTVTFDSVTGYFKGVVDMGNTVATGVYILKVKSDQFLRALVPGIQSITANQQNQMPQVSLVSGDLNNDNLVNILDYNLLMGCYSDLVPATNCAAGDAVRSDITDDSAVNQFDYNLFLREITTKGGQ
jgi:hypothetical protein